MLDTQTGRSLVVAFDHGTEGAIRGGEDLPAMLDLIAGSRADGVLLTTGTTPLYIQCAAKHPDAATVVAGLDIPVFGTRIGCGASLTTTRQPWQPHDAQDAGAVMCKMLLPLGLRSIDIWADALDRIARAAADARRLHLPIMLEPAFWGPESNESDTAILDAARLCIELGASVLKVPAPRDNDALQRLVTWSPVPVLVLGGAPRDGSEFLANVIEWMKAGAVGVVVGRNVWNRPNPLAAIEALGAAVHELDLDRAREHMALAGAPLSAAAGSDEGDHE